ncbi:MAG: hypothetical protein ABIP03_10545 [Aquihabitans sp.]
MLLAVVAAVRRVHALPTDGLWFDDAWVAVGALHGTSSQIAVRGSAHPGFTLLLQAWNALTHSAPNGLAVPALVAGSLGPPLVYLGLRRLRFAMPIACILASVLVVADIHALYSGRVKSYTFDTAGIMVLAAVLPSVAARRWGWRSAARWVVASLVVSSLSGYLLVGTALAIGILALHPNGDRRVRSVALLVQAAGQVSMYLAARRTTDLDAVERFMETTYDGHLSLYRNPLRMAGQLLAHLGRIVDVYTGGPVWVLAPLGIVALWALGASAVGWPNRDRIVTSRYLLLCVAFALIGGLLNRFPFGPDTRNWIAALNSPGGRHSLWLVPVFVVGFALALEAIRTALTARSRLTVPIDLVMVAAAIALMGAAWQPTPRYMEDHSLSAARYTDRVAGPDGLVIAIGPPAYQYASATDREITLLATPENMVGFSPVGAGGRLVAVGEWATLPYDAPTVRRLVGSEERVVLAGSFLGPGASNLAVDTLKAEGFQVTEQFWEQNSLVVVLERSA